MRNFRSSNFVRNLQNFSFMHLHKNAIVSFAHTDLIIFYSLTLVLPPHANIRKALLVPFIYIDVCEGVFFFIFFKIF